MGGWWASLSDMFQLYYAFDISNLSFWQQTTIKQNNNTHMFEFPRDIIPQRFHPNIPTAYFPDIPLIWHAYNLQIKIMNCLTSLTSTERMISAVLWDITRNYKQIKNTFWPLRATTQIVTKGFFRVTTECIYVAFHLT